MAASQFLRSLHAVLGATTEREAIAAIQEGFAELFTGHHHSALYRSVECEAVDMRLLGEEWLGVDHPFSRSIAAWSPEHPFARKNHCALRPATLVRSELMDDAEWQQTSMYREVDAPLGIEDMLGLYFPTPAGHLCAVFCGRKGSFPAAEREGAESFREVAQSLLESRPAAPAPRTERSPAERPLSPREAEIVHWISEGKSNQEIALILGISHHTVRKHLESIYTKLGVENRTSAALAWRERSCG